MHFISSLQELKSQIWILLETGSPVPVDRTPNESPEAVLNEASVGHDVVPLDFGPSFLHKHGPKLLVLADAGKYWLPLSSTVGSEQEIVIDSDDPWLAANIEAESVNAGLVFFFGYEDILHQLRILRNGCQRRLDIAGASRPLHDVVPAGILVTPHGRVGIHVLQALEGEVIEEELALVVLDPGVGGRAEPVELIPPIESVVLVLVARLDDLFEVGGTVV